MTSTSDRSGNSPVGGIPRRTLVLAAIALVLVAVLAAREVGFVSLGGPQVDTDADRRARLMARIGELSRFANAAEAIRSAYQANAFGYAQDVARVRTLVTDGTAAPDTVARDATESVIRSGPVSGADVQAGAPQDRGGGVHEVLVSVEFTTPSDRHADTVIRRLGDPALGAVWAELAVVADAEGERVEVSGQLRTLVIQSAE